MKIVRVLIVIFVGVFAVSGVLRLLKPVGAAPLVDAAAPLDVVINEVAWGGTAAGSAD
jgi:hypothetical protein